MPGPWCTHGFGWQAQARSPSTGYQQVSMFAWETADQPVWVAGQFGPSIPSLATCRADGFPSATCVPPPLLPPHLHLGGLGLVKLGAFATTWEQLLGWNARGAKFRVLGDAAPLHSLTAMPKKDTAPCLAGSRHQWRGVVSTLHPSSTWTGPWQPPVIHKRTSAASHPTWRGGY